MKTVSWGQNWTAVCIGDSQRDTGVANMLVAKISAYQRYNRIIFAIPLSLLNARCRKCRNLNSRFARACGSRGEPTSRWQLLGRNRAARLVLHVTDR